MASRLIECSSCHRFVRDDEESCPFCNAVVDPEAATRAASARRPAIRNVPRAVAFGLSVGMAALSGSAGCEDETEDGSSSSDNDTSQQPPYGAPAVGSGGGGASGVGGDGGRGGDGGLDGAGGGGGRGG